jgi:hypothetical protein
VALAFRHLPTKENPTGIMSIEHLASRIHAEFQELPGLNLTLPQAQRLWGLPPEVCAHVVDVLVDRAVLKRCGARLRLRD